MAPLDPVILTATVKVLSELGKQYFSLGNEAKDNYQKRIAIHSDDPLESKRIKCIEQLNELRTNTAFYVADQDLQQRMWALVMEQTIAAYEATTEQQLRLVEASVEQITAYWKSYKSINRYRQNVRIFGVAISFLFLAAIALFLYYAPSLKVTAESEINILGIPVTVVLWSVVGSFAAILYRFSMSGDRELEDPLRWFFSRPLTGIVMGSITFLVIKVGLLTFAPDSSSQPAAGSIANKELMWLVAFLAGFSDRFSDGLLKSLIGKFGGDTNSELVSTVLASQNKQPFLSWATDLLPNHLRTRLQDSGDSPKPESPQQRAGVQSKPAPTNTTSEVQSRDDIKTVNKDARNGEVVKPDHTSDESGGVKGDTHPG